MRVVNVLVSFPTLLLAIIVITVFGPGLFNAMITIGIAQVPLYARLTRSAVLKVKGLDYVTAARAGGAPARRILWRHVFPNCLPPLIVQSTLFFATAILSAAYLGFLGLGTQPPTPEWGTMLSKARDFLRVAPHVSIFPGLTIMVTARAQPPRRRPPRRPRPPHRPRLTPRRDSNPCFSLERADPSASAAALDIAR